MKISKNEFILIIKENAVNEVDFDTIKANDNLSDIGIDSLGFVTLLWAIENRFNIEVDDQYLESLNGMSTIADLITTLKVCGLEIDID